MANSDFEAQVLKGLETCGINLNNISACGGLVGAAVSGGADSLSLLLALCNLCRPYNIPIKVITVNHFIRPESETCSDVEFVKKICDSLSDQGFNLSLTVHELKKGQVASLAREKGIGNEAAARELRYKAFEDFIAQKKLSCLCLAHNKNDQLETLLMRFLQGAGTDSKAGIPQIRGHFVRPLLAIERSQIEEYLNQKKIKWCTDSTNGDTNYLRNKIRASLMPFLNKEFSGWDKAALTGAQKALDDAELIQSLPMDKDFFKLPRALKIRALLQAANKAGFDRRIPYLFLRDVCDCSDSADNYNGRKVEKRFSELCFIIDKNGLTVKKSDEVEKEIVFSAIIEKSGFYELPAGQVFIPDKLSFPLLVRSWRSGDLVETAEGGRKKLADIFSDWHVPQEKRQYIPVVQELQTPEQKIICILGSCLGYKDWIVKNEKV